MGVALNFQLDIPWSTFSCFANLDRQGDRRDASQPTKSAMRRPSERSKRTQSAAPPSRPRGRSSPPPHSKLSKLPSASVSSKAPPAPNLKVSAQPPRLGTPPSRGRSRNVRQPVMYDSIVPIPEIRIKKPSLPMESQSPKGPAPARDNDATRQPEAWPLPAPSNSKEPPPPPTLQLSLPARKLSFPSEDSSASGKPQRRVQLQDPARPLDVLPQPTSLSLPGPKYPSLSRSKALRHNFPGLLAPPPTPPNAKAASPPVLSGASGSSEPAHAQPIGADVPAKLPELEPRMTQEPPLLAANAESQGAFLRREPSLPQPSETSSVQRRTHVRHVVQRSLSGKHGAEDTPPLPQVDAIDLSTHVRSISLTVPVTPSQDPEPQPQPQPQPQSQTSTTQSLKRSLRIETGPPRPQAHAHPTPPPPANQPRKENVPARTPSFLSRSLPGRHRKTPSLLSHMHLPKLDAGSLLLKTRRSISNFHNPPSTDPIPPPRQPQPPARSTPNAQAPEPVLRPLSRASTERPRPAARPSLLSEVGLVKPDSGAPPPPITIQPRSSSLRSATGPPRFSGGRAGAPPARARPRTALGRAGTGGASTAFTPLGPLPEIDAGAPLVDLGDATALPDAISALPPVRAPSRPRPGTARPASPAKPRGARSRSRSRSRARARVAGRCPPPWPRDGGGGLPAIDAGASLFDWGAQLFDWGVQKWDLEEKGLGMGQGWVVVGRAC